MSKKRVVWLALAFCQEVWAGPATQNQKEKKQVPDSALLHGSLEQWFKQEAMTGWKGEENDEWNHLHVVVKGVCCASI